MDSTGFLCFARRSYVDSAMLKCTPKTEKAVKMLDQPMSLLDTLVTTRHC